MPPAKPLVIQPLGGRKTVSVSAVSSNLGGSKQRIQHQDRDTKNTKDLGGLLIQPQEKSKSKKTSSDSKPFSWLHNKDQTALVIAAASDANLDVDNWYSRAGHFAVVTSDILEGNVVEDAIPASSSVNFAVTNDTEFQRIRNDIKARFEQEVKLYLQLKATNKLSGDQKWINDVIKSGTLSDKVAGLALRVQESPIHELSTLDILVDLCCRHEQRHASLALEAIKDLLVHNLLPDRRLQSLQKCPLKHPNMTLEHALLFYYEDQLIDRVVNVLNALENGLKSTVDHFKRQCLEIAAELLMSKPEQESRLLMMLVNKLGDPSSKIVSKSLELLKQLVQLHPAMRSTVVREVRQLIYRPDINPRVIYNGILFLVQISLTKNDHELATQLVEGYISLFEKAVSREELKSKLLAALLTGINRAFPFLRQKDTLIKHVDSLFNIVHNASFATSTQALVLISHIALTESMYSKTKAKVNAKQQTTPAKTEEGETIVGEETIVEKTRVTKLANKSDLETELTNRYYRALYAKLMVDQVYTRSKNAMFLNLIFRSIKRDPSVERAAAFVKRLCMSSLQASAPIASGFLFLISEIVKSKPELIQMITTTESNVEIDMNGTEESKGKAQTVHVTSDEEIGMHKLGFFDAEKREPLFALSGGQPGLWELSLLQTHFHPSVQVFAKSLASTETSEVSTAHEIIYAGDPTTDFSLLAFLNRFAYKNPKKNHGEGNSAAAHRRHVTEELPINRRSFIHKDIEKVEADKLFFHRFFGEREKLQSEGRAKLQKSKKRSSKDSDDEDDDDDGNLDVDGDLDDGGGENDVDFDMGSSRAGDEDEEAAIDRFADKLAEDLMRSAENGDELGSDFDGADIDSDSDDDSGDEGFQYAIGNAAAADDEDGDDDDSSLGGDDLDIDDAESDDALDFEDFKKGTSGKKVASNKNEKKNKRKQKVADPDSDSEDDYELTAYGDNDDDDDDDNDDASVVEFGSDIDDNSSDEGDLSDFEPLGMDDDARSNNKNNKNNKNSSSKLMKSKPGKPSAKENQKKNNGKASGSSVSVPVKGNKRSGQSDFAAAEDYELEVDRIIQMVRAQAPDEASSGGGKKQNSKDKKGDSKEAVFDKGPEKSSGVGVGDAAKRPLHQKNGQQEKRPNTNGSPNRRDNNPSTANQGNKKRKLN